MAVKQGLFYTSEQNLLNLDNHQLSQFVAVQSIGYFQRRVIC
jgi:hypothetical protein